MNKGLFKNSFFFALLVTFLISPFQVNAMFGRGEKKKITFPEAPAEITEQQRRATDAADLDEENVSSQAARGTTFHVSEIEDTDQQEGGEKEEEKVTLSLENFRAAAENPNLAGVERLIIDSGSNAIRPWSKVDSRLKGKNKAFLVALKTALQLEFPMFQPALIDKIVDEELPHSSTWSMFEKLQGKPSLSTETLQRILEKADNAMAERAFVEEKIFTLQHFRNALANPDHHGAQRLIIRDEGASAMIIAKTADPRNTSKNRSADTVIRKTLKLTLENEGHRREAV
ncbi:MAG: hypothetical protein NT164_07415 [Verrucomicrobiae bacterium]|nr:hypothetical protein [Verrucomicrobiae bacterium]